MDRKEQIKYSFDCVDDLNLPDAISFAMKAVILKETYDDFIHSGGENEKAVMPVKDIGELFAEKCNDEITLGIDLNSDIGIFEQINIKLSSNKWNQLNYLDQLEI